VVAVIGHELAHFVNGDVTRGLVVGEAIRTVATWCRLLTPDESDRDREIMEVLAAVSLWLVSWIPRSLLGLMVHLSWMQAQQAEYHADRVGASLSGSAAFVGLLERSLDQDLLEHAGHRVVVAGQGTSIVHEFCRVLAGLPPRERERRRRRAAAEPTALDATHPPTGLRCRLLLERPALMASFPLDPRRHAALRAELAPTIAICDESLASDHARQLSL